MENTNSSCLLTVGQCLRYSARTSTSMKNCARLLMSGSSIISEYLTKNDADDWINASSPSVDLSRRMRFLRRSRLDISSSLRVRLSSISMSSLTSALNFEEINEGESCSIDAG